MSTSSGMAACPSRNLLVTGAGRFDAALGGGLPGAGLTEIHAPIARDAGTAAAFVLALVRLVLERTAAPILWVGMAESFREAGYPYPPGMRFLYGIDASHLLIAQADKLSDALWIADQAARLDGFSAVLLETRGMSACLDLTATRRLHHRARDAGHPLFLLRQTAQPEPTAAPFRLIVRSAPAGLRHVLGKPLARSIGPPGFLVEISKNRTAPPTQFTLEWNIHANAFRKEGPFRKERRRILSLWFPHLSTERLLRQRLGRSWRSHPPQGRPPLVVSRQENNTQRIAALDEEAERLRLKPGMGIADARAMYPSIEIVAEDPEADRRLIEALADWCDRYTPLVALDGTDGLFLDITGCAHLFGGEEALLDSLLDNFFEQGFRTRAGLASTPGAAWAAARFSLPGKILQEGDERPFLESLPLAALRLEAGTITRLESVGLRTDRLSLGRARARRSPAASARLLLLRLDQALGEIEEVISPRLPVAPFSVERHLADPIGLIEDIERLIFLLARSLKRDLERRGEGARLFELLLFRVDGAVSRISAGASLPLREPRLDLQALS